MGDAVEYEEREIDARPTRDAIRRIAQGHANAKREPVLVRWDDATPAQVVEPEGGEQP